MPKSLKKILLALSTALLFASCSKDKCIQILHLQPGADFGKDAYLHEAFPDKNSGNAKDNLVGAWTYNAIGGSEGALRSLLEFDLSSIPSTAKIKSAHLSLFYSTGTGNLDGGHSQRSGSNDAHIFLVTESWNEHEVTWNTQPAFDANQKIYLPKSTSQTEDYLDIDVLDFVTTWHRSPNTNNGILIKLNNESIYRGLAFGSSDQPDADARPKLVVKYSLK